MTMTRDALLRAIVARVAGDFDHPDLVAFGPLNTRAVDLRDMARRIADAPAVVPFPPAELAAVWGAAVAVNATAFEAIGPAAVAGALGNLVDCASQAALRERRSAVVQRDAALDALAGLVALTLEMGTTIRGLDENSAHIEEWTNDGEEGNPDDPGYVPDERFHAAQRLVRAWRGGSGT